MDEKLTLRSKFDPYSDDGDTDREYNRSSTDGEPNPTSSSEDTDPDSSDTDPDSSAEERARIILDNTEEFKTYLESVVVCFGNHNKSDSQDDMEKKEEIFNAQSFKNHCVPMLVPALPFLK